MRVSPELTEGIVLIYRRLLHGRFCIKGIMTIKSEVLGFSKELLRAGWRWVDIYYPDYQ